MVQGYMHREDFSCDSDDSSLGDKVGKTPFP